MTTPPAFSLPETSVLWDDIARACRRMCVLRERGLPGEAERVAQTDLAALLARLRAGDESPAAIDARLETLLATERARVAEAAVLASLLAPLLHEPPPRPAAPPLPAAQPPPASRARAASIADFIDEMIAQEKP